MYMPHTSSEDPQCHEILAYSEYRTIKAMEIIEDDWARSGLGLYDEQNRKAEEWNKKYYRGATGICTFCNVQMIAATETAKSPYDQSIWECPVCGWWELERAFRSGGVAHEVAFSAIHHQACIKRFDVRSASTPTEALVEHLRKKPDIVYGINKKKMEEVVQYVFSCFYNCEVHHCGKSHDGGVDLVMIGADKPTLIQVKCREDSTAVEPISQIRDFLGAMWINKSTRGIFVSTADHYSSVSVNTIREMLADHTLTFFDMVNFSRLADLFTSTPSPKQDLWERLFNEFFIQGETG